MSSIVKTLVLSVCLLLLVSASGCASVGRKAAERATGVKVDQDGEKVTVETDEGTAEVSTGESNELPEGFPKDLPVYDGTITNQSRVKTGDATIYTVLLATDDAFDDVVSWYDSEIPDSGWTEEGSYSTESGGIRNAAFQLKKGDLTATINVQLEDGEPKAQIMMSVSEK